MKTMTMSEAIRKARDGKFDFTSDCKQGYNHINKRNKKGEWKAKVIYIEGV